MNDTETETDSKTESKSEAKTEIETAPGTPAPATPAARETLAETLAKSDSKAARRLAEAEAKAIERKSKADEAIAFAKSRRDDKAAQAAAKKAESEARRARWAAHWAKAKATAFVLWKRASSDPYNFWTATVYVFATYMAMNSQFDTAKDYFRLSEPKAMALAFVLEGFAIGFAGTRRNLRLKRQTGLLSTVSLVGQWTAVGLAAFINYHSHSDLLIGTGGENGEGLPLFGYAMAAVSVGAMLLFEIRTSAKIRTMLQNMERLPVPHPVFGLQYAIAFRKNFRWAKLASIASSAELTRGEAIARGAQMREAKAVSDLSNRLASEAKAAFAGYRKAASKAALNGKTEAASYALESALTRLQDVARYGLDSAAFEAARASSGIVTKAEAEEMVRLARLEVEDEVARREEELYRLQDHLESLERQYDIEVGELRAELADTRSHAMVLESKLAETKAIASESVVKPSPPARRMAPGEIEAAVEAALASPPTSPSRRETKAKTSAESEWKADFRGDVDLEAWAMANWADRPQPPNIWALRIAALAEEFPGELGSRDGAVIPRMARREKSYGLFWTNRGWVSRAMHDLRALREAGLQAPAVVANPQGQFES